MPQRILVVEDYAPFRRLTCDALRRRGGFEIFEAADGLEALQKAEELQPDLILLDIHLPKLHGFEVAGWIGRLAPDAQLLFMSQESSADIVRRGFSLGGRAYIHKQQAAGDLLAAIDAVLDGRQFVSSSVSPRRHEILFCSDDAAVVDGLVRFVAVALNAADGAIAVVTESHRHDLLHRLHTEGVDIASAVERGAYLSLDADDALDSVRFFDAIDGVREAAIRAGKAHPRVALCGERAGRLWACGRTAEAVQLERFCRGLAHDVDILCLYPVPYTAEDHALEDVCAEHTRIRVAGR